MLDIKIIRENPDVVKKDLKKRGDTDKVKLLEELIKKDLKRRELIQETEKLKHERNVLTKEISGLKRVNKNSEKQMKTVKKITDKIKELDSTLQEIDTKCTSIMMRIPNILHDSVPTGKDDKDNKEVKRWGQKPKFDFEPKNHLEIAEALDFIDTERAAKTSGHGFVFLKGSLALMDQAIIKFTVDFMTKKGYTLIEPPLMIHRKPYEGVTDLADFENVMYKIENDDLYLIATSEHAMASMFMNETLNKKNMPLKFIGVSPCFRREVGAHGKYTKGLFRTHHFNKIEQFIFCIPEESWKMHEELQKNCEELYQALGLHYRVVNVCTGDIGSIAAKKYDTEVWMSDSVFREIGSNSNCTDYQARRLNIKYKDQEGKPPKGFVHTLNNTALATSRTMVAILEQFQQKDGSVLVPKALWPYMNGIKKLEKK
jgi:seryl-tRNA synthetase